MKYSYHKCDICGEPANIVARVIGKTRVAINVADGHGDYTFTIGKNTEIDLCQAHKDDVLKLLSAISELPPEVEKVEI